MAKKIIELFVSFERASAGGSMSGKMMPMSGGGLANAKNRYAGRHMSHSFSGYDDKEKAVFELLDKISQVHDIEVITYDTTKREGRRMAKNRDVSETPSLVIGDKILTGYIHETDLLRALGIPVDDIEIKQGQCPDCNSSNIELFRDRSGQCKDCGSVFMEAK